MTIINTLEEWYKNAILISSPFLIKPTVARNKVTFIYDTLKQCFGEKFFQLKMKVDIPADKSIWINQLLANKNHIGSIGALFQIAQLIAYANTLDNKISEEIKRTSKSPRNLRTFFYELFIFNILDNGQIPNQKKITSGNQEIEGVCTLNNNHFIFECRKVFMPRIEDLDIKKRLIEVFYLKSRNMNKAIGMICGIKMNRPIKSIYRHSFEEKISAYFTGINKSKGFDVIDYTVEDETGLFKAYNYDEASLLEAKELSNYDVLFYLIPGNVKNEMIHFRGATQAIFQVPQTDIYKKLENILKEKKNQHKNSIYKNKLIFIDTEIFPGLDMDLFQTETSHNLDMLKAAYDKVCRDTILCVTRRIYSNEHPEIKTTVLFPKKFELEAKHLLSCFN